MSPTDRDDVAPIPSSTGQQMVGVAACPTRLQLLLLLKTEGPQDVLQVAARSRQSQPLVSGHLKGLWRLGLCVFEIEGRRHVYRLADERTVQLHDVGVEFQLFGGDGSVLRFMVPFSSPDYRILALPPQSPTTQAPIADQAHATSNRERGSHYTTGIRSAVEGTIANVLHEAVRVSRETKARAIDPT